MNFVSLEIVSDEELKNSENIKSDGRGKQKSEIQFCLLSKEHLIQLSKYLYNQLQGFQFQ